MRQPESVRKIWRRITTAVFRLLQIVLILSGHIVPVSSMKKHRQAIPKFLPTPTNITVHKGEHAELPCHINNLGPKMVVWRKASDEHPLTIGPTTFTPAGDISVAYNKLSDTVSQWNLMIKNVRPRHAGVYECQISSRGIYTHYVALNVLDEPLRRKKRFNNQGYRICKSV